jgi:ABC-type polysaccharide/polyol phosphate transport system ATPase subunit
MIRIYKLKYTDRETAIADLIAKGVYQEMEGELSYSEDIHAVVEIGLILDQEATFDENGNLLTEPTYREGYHFDIMVEKDIDFGDNEIFPNSAKHTFAGIN